MKDIWERDLSGQVNLRQISPDVPQELPLGLRDAPLVRLQAQELIVLRREAMQGLTQLQPVAFIAAIMRETRGGISSPALDGRVSGTRSPKRPKLDSRDRTLGQRQRDYRRELNSILDCLSRMQNIEKEVIVQAHIAEQHERQAAAEEAGEKCGECAVCGRTIGANRKDPILAGMCKNHWNQWVSAGRPDLPLWQVYRRKQLQDTI